jgi:hypothetical protein
MAKFELQLRDGRSIFLCEIRQSATYEGLLEGLPTRQMNARILASAAQAEILYGVEWKPHIIQTIETPIDWTREKPYPFGEPAQLPPIQCQARFESFRPARDASLFASGVIFVWFQNSWALPIDEEVLEQMKAVVWNEVATDFEP